jgi:hypothetical protein
VDQDVADHPCQKKGNAADQDGGNAFVDLHAIHAA